MAQKVQVSLTDDLEAHRSKPRVVAADETVRFGFEGRAYEIDLTSQNAGKFRKDMGPYLDAARLVKNGKPKRTVQARHRSADIRVWAREQGIELSERGRIPASVVEEYEAAH